MMSIKSCHRKLKLEISLDHPQNISSFTIFNSFLLSMLYSFFINKILYYSYNWFPNENSGHGFGAAPTRRSDGEPGPRRHIWGGRGHVLGRAD